MNDVTTTVTAEAIQDGGAPLGANPIVEGVQQTAQNGNSAQYSYNTNNSEQKVVSVPTSAMKRIKDEERERGRREALDVLAQQAGYASHLELVQALSSLKNTPTKQQTNSNNETQETSRQQNQTQTTQATSAPKASEFSEKNEQRAAAKYERQVEKLLRERDTYAQKYSTANTELKRLKEALDAKEAEVSLREIAVASGVSDVDYALRLFYRDIENKSEDELQKYDEKAFFQSLRQSKPYLFGEVVKPANTGTGTGNAPTAPRPGQVQAQTVANGQFDARKASAQEIQERLRRMGLNPHG